MRKKDTPTRRKDSTKNETRWRKIKAPAGATYEDVAQKRFSVAPVTCNSFEHLGIQQGDLLVLYNAGDESQDDLVSVVAGEDRFLGFLNITSSFEAELNSYLPHTKPTLMSNSDDEEGDGLTLKPHEFQFTGRVIEVRRKSIPVKLSCELRPLHDLAEQEGAL